MGGITGEMVNGSAYTANGEGSGTLFPSVICDVEKNPEVGGEKQCTLGNYVPKFALSTVNSL